MESCQPSTSDAVSDSDDELPSLCVEIDKNWLDTLVAGDIIWAKYRHLYWPALVRHVYRKDKKVSVWYLDSPNKSFKLPFMKIKCFSDYNISSKILKEADKSPMSVKHKRVYLDALTFLRRKGQGYDDDPAEFFDWNKHYFAFKYMKISSKNNENKEISSPEKSNLISGNLSSDEESLYSDSDEEKVLINTISKYHDVNDSADDDPKIDLIVCYIVSGNTDKHLVRVKEKREPSEYHKIFEEAMKTDKRKLFEITACDIVKNPIKLREISVYLLNLYEKYVEGGKCEMVNYVTCVWLPEAINKAVEIIDKDMIKSIEDIPNYKRRLFPIDKLLIQENDSLSILMQEEDVNNKSSKKKPNVKNSTKKCDTSVSSREKSVSKTSVRKSPRKKFKS